MRINAGDKSTGNAQDNAIAEAYGNKFIIPLDFEMLDSAASYYQAGPGNRLCYELTFNDYNRVTKSAVSSPKVPDVKCNNKKRSHTQLDSRKQVIAFQDRVITINIKEAQHPLK